MIKQTFTIILVILTSFSLVNAQEILEYTAQINVEGTILRESVSITVANNQDNILRRLTYPFSSQVKELKTYDGGGGLESEVRLRGENNYVTTELRDPMGPGENATVLYEFRDSSSVSFFNDTYVLSTSFPLLANVRRFELTLRLPEGTGLKTPSLDVVPAPSEITSDGRAVILRWVAENPSDFRIFVRYVPLPPPEESTTTIATTTTTIPQIEEDGYVSEETLLILSVLLLVIFSSLLILKLKSRTNDNIETRIDILKNDEQLILKIVAEENGIEQREIQRKTDFSKTKVSKILAELEKRGVIRKESMGKKNKVYLTQRLRE